MIGLTHKCDLYRPTATTGALNEAVYSLPDDPTRQDVRCRISSLSLEDREKLQAFGASISQVGAMRIMFAGEEDILVDDVIDHDGKRWKIIGVEDVDQRGVVLETYAVTAMGVIDT